MFDSTKMSLCGLASCLLSAPLLAQVSIDGLVSSQGEQSGAVSFNSPVADIFSGKWRGVAACADTVFELKLKPQAVRNGLVIEWDGWGNNYRRPIMNQLFSAPWRGVSPPSGLRQVDFDQKSQRLTVKHRDGDWIANRVGASDKMVFVPTGRNAQHCSDLILYSDKKVWKPVWKLAGRFAKARIQNRDMQSAVDYINLEAQAVHVQTIQALYAPNAQNRSAITHLRGRLDPRLQKIVSQWDQELQADEATRNFVSRYNRIASRPLESVAAYANLARAANIQSIRYRRSRQSGVPNQAAVERVNNDARSKFRAGFSETAFREYGSVEKTTKGILAFKEWFDPADEFANDDRLSPLKMQMNKELALARVEDKRRADAAARAFAASPQGRFQAARDIKNDDFSELPGIAATRMRLLLKGDFEAINFGNKQLAQDAPTRVLGPLAALMPGMNRRITREIENSRMGGLLANYILRRSDKLGICGERSTTFGAETVTVRRYVNGYGTQVGPEETVGRRKWTFRVPSRFAKVIYDTEEVKDSIFFRGIDRFLDKHGCSSSVRRKLESNMLRYYAS